MAIKTRVIKKSAAIAAKKAIKSGKEMVDDVIDRARPAVKALKKAAARKAKDLKKAAAPRVKKIKKATAAQVKVGKKVATRAMKDAKERAREATRDALYAGSKGLKRAAKKI